MIGWRRGLGHARSVRGSYFLLQMNSGNSHYLYVIESIEKKPSR